MKTDENRLRKSDPGDPDICNLFPYHTLMTDAAECERVREGCTGATWGCVDCKKLLLQSMEAFLGPMQARRRELEADPGAVWDILRKGDEKAAEESAKTLAEVRERLNLNF